MEELIKFGHSTIIINSLDELMFNMEPHKFTKLESDKKVWFSMWFLGAIITFGIALFPMFYRLIENRNYHFKKEETLEKQVIKYLQDQKKTPIQTNKHPYKRNTKMWTAAIILIVPVFIITYLLSKDLTIHEAEQEKFLAQVCPERIFMTQTIPIKTYALITVVTLGFGIIYWLYKIVNQYNAHYRAHIQIEKKISSLMEEKKVDEQ
jgi:NADH:ubiquinone oxidoreductase subunit 5 (subunit L)/multisubunit Na+/H+ antiporter MnhA subunit